MAEQSQTLEPNPSDLHLVATKLHIPSKPAGFVTRQRLLNRLDQGLGRGLTLVCAPPGFGKSVLLAEWCHRSGAAIGWVSLDLGDNDPVRFWRHVVAALDQALDDSELSVAEIVGPLIGESATGDFEAPAAVVINTLASVDDDVVLVLDDYHVIEEQVVHASISFLLEHAPPGLHIGLISRADPPLLLTQRGRGVS